MTDNREVPRTGACPGAEALAGLALREGGADERRALADHVVGCAACAADFRMLRELHGEAARRERPSRRAWLTAAAAAVAAVALAPLLLRDTEDRVRGGATPTRPADGAVLSEAPEALAWPAQPGATGYHVKLFRGDASALWQAEAREPAAPLPREVREGMRAGGSWYWTVEALGPVQRRRLGPFWFELRPP